MPFGIVGPFLGDHAKEDLEEPLSQATQSAGMRHAFLAFLLLRITGVLCQDYAPICSKAVSILEERFKVLPCFEPDDLKNPDNEVISMLAATFMSVT